MGIFTRNDSVEKLAREEQQKEAFRVTARQWAIGQAVFVCEDNPDRVIRLAKEIYRETFGKDWDDA